MTVPPLAPRLPESKEKSAPARRPAVLRVRGFAGKVPRLSRWWGVAKW
jgi:hypothetical protein